MTGSHKSVSCTNDLCPPQHVSRLSTCHIASLDQTEPRCCCFIFATVLPPSSFSAPHSRLACNVLFFIDKLQSIFTNGIILKILLQLLLLQLLLLVKRIVICFSMHLLLFSLRSLSEVTTLSSICTHSGQRGSGRQRDCYLAAFARCARCLDSTRLDSTSHCKAAFDRDLCLLVVLLIKMHFYCFTLSLHLPYSPSLPLYISFSAFPCYCLRL